MNSEGCGNLNEMPWPAEQLRNDEKIMIFT